MKPIITFIFLLFYVFSFGQLSHFTKFRKITSEDGLPQNSIKGFLQDNDGYMWFATGDGLSCYNGYSFKTFRPIEDDPSTILSSTVECFILDNEGSLWLGHAEGISVLNKETGKCKRIQFNDDTTALWPGRIRAICKSDDGRIWIGTSAGLNYFDPITKKINRVVLSDPSDPDFNQDRNTIWSLFADGNNLWIGTYRGGGLFCLNTKTFKKRHFKNEPGNPNSLISDYVVHIVKDKSGLMWFATRNGLSSYDEKTDTFSGYNYDPNDPTSISSHDLWAGMLVDSKNNLWIGTITDGLNLLDRNTGKFIRFKHMSNYKHSLSNNTIYGIYEDKSGLIWIGTYNGANIFNPYQISFESLQSIPGEENSLAGDHVTFIEKDRKGKVWLGIGSEGIDIYDPATGNIRHLSSDPNDPQKLPSNAVRDICFDENNLAYIILHSTPAVVSYDYETGIIKKIGGGWGKSIHSDMNGKVWVGTSSGLGTLDSIDMYNQSSIGDKKMRNHNIVFIQNCDKDNLWIGAGNTIAKFNTRKRAFTYFENEHNLFCMFYDSKRRLWAGSSSGLKLLDPSNLNLIESYGLQDGFSNQLISSVNEDEKGILWLGSNYGLISFNPENRKVQNFDFHDGLPDNEFNMGSVELNGKFYIATVRGVLVLDPEKIIRNQHKPPISITGISVLNKPYFMSDEEKRTQTLTFTHEQYFFTIEFAALDFVHPGKNRFAYKLIGFNEDWIDIGNKHEVTFTNLNPGEYTLLIKASNSHGVWNEEGIELTIIILPPWWKTTWFRVTALIAILLIIFGIFTWRTANLKRQKRILENTVKERTMEVVHQKEIIEEKQKEIIDSINYARRLQQAILTPETEIKKYFPASFLLYQPKDIVAGDFYFFEVTETHIFYAAADCTGHGVPGAMVSIVCSNALSRCVYEFNLTDPGKILDKARELIMETFRKSSDDVKDGMDISLIAIERIKNTIEWVGANNPLWIIRSGGVVEIAADKQPIGKSYNQKPFTTNSLKIEKGDSIILFTDGYADQFGGPKGKKFKYSNLQKLLLENADSKPELIKAKLESVFYQWKGDLEQVDDVCIIGIRI